MRGVPGLTTLPFLFPSSILSRAGRTTTSGDPGQFVSGLLLLAIAFAVVGMERAGLLDDG